MWKRLLETAKQAIPAAAVAPKPATSAATPAAVAPKPATPAATTAAVAPKPATPGATTAAAPSASKRGTLAAAPKLSTLKSPSYRRRAAAGPETAVTQASLLRLKQAAASKKTNLPSSLPLAHAHALDEDDPPEALTKALMSVLDAPDEAECATSLEAPAEDSEDDGEVGTSNKILDFEWFQTQPSRDPLMHWRREVAREKKKHYIFKNVESRRYTKLMRMCANRLGTESTIEFFGKLGRETGVKEFNSMIKLCLDKAKACRDIDSAVEYI